MPRNLFEKDGAGLVAELNNRKKLWKPRHDRMDAWMAAYLLQDAYQENKPLGQRRFISNEPMTIVDTSHRVISRHPIQWRIAIDEQKKDDEETERLYGDLERSLYGFMEDIEEGLLERGEISARMFAAYQGLLRGMIACKVHFTEKEERESGIIYANYDSRFVLPSYDTQGLSSVIIETPLVGADIAEQYPDNIPNNFNPLKEMVKVEVWDKVKQGVAIRGMADNTQAMHWVLGPEEHGFFGKDGENQKGRANRLPFVIRDVNPLPIAQKPAASMSAVNPQRENDLLPRNLRNMSTAVTGQLWRTTRMPIAERGRGILASIERHIGQFNEAVSSVWQHHSLDAFGVYFMATKGGQVPEDITATLGSGGIAGIERGDTIQRFGPGGTSEAGLQFLQVLQDERQKGTIASVLQALGEFRSGFLQARMEQVALNALEPYIVGMQDWAGGVGQQVLDQIKYSDAKKKFRLPVTRDENEPSNKHFYTIEFDPQFLRGLEFRPKVHGLVEAALPVDMMERATIANTLVNGRRPLISRSTAQERVLRIPDSARENDRIWEDMAELDPVVMLEQIAAGLERRGEVETAKIFRDRQMTALAIEMAQQMQIQGMLGGRGNGQPVAPGGAGGESRANPEASVDGVRPSEQPPEFRGEA